MESIPLHRNPAKFKEFTDLELCRDLELVGVYRHPNGEELWFDFAPTDRMNTEKPPIRVVLNPYPIQVGNTIQAALRFEVTSKKLKGSPDSTFRKLHDEYRRQPCLGMDQDVVDHEGGRSFTQVVFYLSDFNIADRGKAVVVNTKIELGVDEQISYGLDVQTTEWYVMEVKRR